MGRPTKPGDYGFLKDFAAEQFSPDADLLVNVQFTRRSAGTLLLVGLVLLLASAGVFGELLAPYGQRLAFVWALVLPVTVGLSFAHRRYGANPPMSLVYFILAFAALPSGLTGLIAAAVVPAVRTILDPMGGPLVGGLAGVAVSLIWAVYLSWRSRILRAMRNQLAKERERRDLANYERDLAEARLQALQGQIEPHFLYNTLANVQQLVRSRPDDADLLLKNLVKYLREALPRMREKASTLRQEFALAEAYLNIARIRLGQRLEVDVSLPEELGDHSFPPLIIQTLVENALKHGVDPMAGSARIGVKAVALGNDVQVIVSDNGVGLGEQQGSGVGLRNTRERLKAIYGSGGQLELRPNVPTGVVVTVRVPR